MGAAIRIKGRNAIIKGVDNISGAEVGAGFERGSRPVLAGIERHRQTIVNDIYHIDRGYERIEDLLKKLGADIRRI